MRPKLTYVYISAVACRVTALMIGSALELQVVYGAEDVRGPPRGTPLPGRGGTWGLIGSMCITFPLGKDRHGPRDIADWG